LKETHVRISIFSISVQSKTALAAILMAGLLTAAGCASAPPPTAELTQARTLVNQAEQSGALQYAGEDLASARSKLEIADQDAQRDPVQSIWMAQEASADARVAMARANAVKAQIALRDVNAGTQTLRSETQLETTVVVPLTPQ
jgi:hypothetical protein